MLNYTTENIVFLEVPDEVSLAYTISGCTLGCKGCHSSDSWHKDNGAPLSLDYFSQRLKAYQGLISCVLFLGGEWELSALLPLLKLARSKALNTCLYTGLDDVTPTLKAELTYLKTGRWLAELGGLDSPFTNQRFTDLRTGQCLNHRFTCN